MYNYRISKYNPICRNKEKVYLKNDWTSFTDIGKEFNDGKLQKKKYLMVENQYIEFFINLFASLRIKNIFVQGLEKYIKYKDIELMMKEYDLLLSEKQKIIFDNIYEGCRYDINDLGNIIVLLMRDCMWCRILDENNMIEVDIGYELYFHINSKSKIAFLESFEQQGMLYLEKYWLKENDIQIF